MKPKELLRLVWINITQNKFKVIMTSIGIIVGAATIVMVIAIGKGGQADVADQFKNLNAGAVDISYDGGTDFGGGGSSYDSESGIARMAQRAGSGGGPPARPCWRRAAAPAEALAAVPAEHHPAIWGAVPHRAARHRAEHRGERCLPVTAAVCRIWETFSVDRAIWKIA